MRWKINSLLMSFIFAASQSNAQLLPKINPYSIGPHGKSVEDLKDFAKPNKMVAILPNRPVASTDFQGNKQYFTPNGKVVMVISTNGRITYSLGNMEKTADFNGKLISVEKNIRGTNFIEVRNEFGDVISYHENGFGGKIIKEYDKDKNLIRTYTYDTYGKTITAITNELAQSKTIYNKGLADYDVDADGSITARYVYDRNKKLILKIDANGYKTHYDKKQNAAYTENKDGIVFKKYKYVYDHNGNYVIDCVYDPSTRETTYYKDGKEQYTKNYAGAIIKDFLWHGSMLVFTFDRLNQQTVWYDVSGRVLYITFNDEIISKNLYYKGHLVGIWDKVANKVSVCKNERVELSLQLKSNEEPTAEAVQSWIDKGLLEQKYLINDI